VPMHFFIGYTTNACMHKISIENRMLESLLIIVFSNSLSI